DLREIGRKRAGAAENRNAGSAHTELLATIGNPCVSRMPDQPLRLARQRLCEIARRRIIPRRTTGGVSKPPEERNWPAPSQRWTTAAAPEPWSGWQLRPRRRHRGSEIRQTRS